MYDHVVPIHLISSLRFSEQPGDVGNVNFLLLRRFEFSITGMPPRAAELCRNVELILAEFRPAFRRNATFVWFLVIIWAMMLRLDVAGVTSIVRCMGLDPKHYVSLLHFFHSSAFSVVDICTSWKRIVFALSRPVQVGGRPICAVDAIKVGKAGRKMPGVKLLHQESSDNTKPDYIMGHFWGAVSLLSHACGTVVSIPLRFQIQDGLKRSPSEVATLVDKMADLVLNTLAGTNALVVGDAYYSNQKMLRSLMTAGLDYIGKMKISTIAYERPVAPERPRRGRPRKRGAKVKLRELFNESANFHAESLYVYGKMQEVRYLSRELLWHDIVVRFVLSIMPDGSRAIISCSDLSLTDAQIIVAYGWRQKIEVSFKSMVHTLCAFGYHFWLQRMKKRKRGMGNQYLHRADEAIRRQILRKIEAYERFVNIAGIALGVLQVVGVRYADAIWQKFPVWFRTLPRHGFPSELVVRLTLQHELHQIFLQEGQPLEIQKILADKSAHQLHGHPIEIAA